MREDRTLAGALAFAKALAEIPTEAQIGLEWATHFHSFLMASVSARGRGAVSGVHFFDRVQVIEILEQGLHRQEF